VSDPTTHPHGPVAEEFDGESYLASLSDLMVGMLFVFILMLMAFALTYRTAQDASERSNKELQDQLGEVESAERLLTENDSVRRKMLRTLKEELVRRGVQQVIIDEQSGVLRLPDKLLFESGEAELRRSGIEPLKTLASIMTSILPCYSLSENHEACSADARPILEAVYIEGHTDNRPIRSVYKSNWELSTARAVNTYRTLTETEPSLLRLENLDRQSLLGVSGYSDARPVAPNDSPEGQAQNRRIDFRFILAAPSKDDLERIKERAGKALEKDLSQ
jgi:chemotaxis protein MotB